MCFLQEVVIAMLSMVTADIKPGRTLPVIPGTW